MFVRVWYVLSMWNVYMPFELYSPRLHLFCQTSLAGPCDLIGPGDVEHTHSLRNVELQ